MNIYLDRETILFGERRGNDDVQEKPFIKPQFPFIEAVRSVRRLLTDSPLVFQNQGGSLEFDPLPGHRLKVERHLEVDQLSTESLLPVPTRFLMNIFLILILVAAR
jgi:hypothetical protein